MSLYKDRSRKNEHCEEKKMTNRIEHLEIVRKYCEQPVAKEFENLQTMKNIYKLQLIKEEIGNVQTNLLSSLILHTYSLIQIKSIRLRAITKMSRDT